MLPLSLRDRQRLYLMENEVGLRKIGISDNPERRRNQIQHASGLSIRIVRCWRCLDATALEVEQYLHHQFSRRRRAGEWFTTIHLTDIELCGYELVECNHNGTEKRVKE